MNTQEAFDRLTGIGSTELGKSIAALAAIPRPPEHDEWITDADYLPLPSEPICNVCGQPCNTLSFDVTVDFYTGHKEQEHVSACCRSRYTIGRVAV